jgi:hypothetical protein
VEPVIFIVSNVEPVIRSVKRLTWLPYKGIVKGRLSIESYVDRSVAQRNAACLNSIETGKNRNIAKRIGIWRSIGRHPPIGFTPALLYRSMVACCFLRASSFLGNFFPSSSTWGLSTCIFAVD